MMQKTSRIPQTVCSDAHLQGDLTFREIQYKKVQYIWYIVSSGWC